MRQYRSYRHLLAPLLTASILTGIANLARATEPLFPIAPPGDSTQDVRTFDRTLIGDEPITTPLGSGRAEWLDDPGDGERSVPVTGQQAGRTIDEPLFVTPGTTLTWFWRKEAGTVSILQIQLRNPETGQTRYLGYGADGQWLNLFRQLFVFEDGDSLWLTPALFRRWHEAGNRVKVAGLATHFGRVDLEILPDADGNRLDYQIRITPQGDQTRRPLERLVLYPRIAGGRSIRHVVVDGQPHTAFTRDQIVLALPERGRPIRTVVDTGDW